MKKKESNKDAVVHLSGVPPPSPPAGHTLPMLSMAPKPRDTIHLRQRRADRATPGVSDWPGCNWDAQVAVVVR